MNRCFPDCPTIASEEQYAEWRDAVIAELQKRNADVAEAFDWYSFRLAFSDYGMSPAQAVDDCEQWMKENCDVA